MTALWTTFARPSERRSPPTLALSAHGTRVQFADGIEAFDAASGLWNVPLGYGRGEIAEAVSDALLHSSYLTLFRRAHPMALEASERLVQYAGAHLRGVIHSTSGGAANDAMMKLVRQHWVSAGSPERTLIVGLVGSYHGLTYGAHSLSADALGHRAYGIDQRSIRHVRFDDDGEQVAALVRREGRRIAAIVIEPVLGSGAHAVPDSFLQVVFAACEEHGILLVADEVATGFGRTGQPFASGSWHRLPDAVVVSKALTNGSVAAAAVLVGERIAVAAERSDQLFVHGETQAGTPANCAAILATLDLGASLGLDALWAGVRTELDAVVDRLSLHPAVRAVSGIGCFRAVQLLDPTEGVPPTSGAVLALVERVRRAGAIVHPGPGALQLLPPAVSTAGDLRTLDVAIREALDEWSAETRCSSPGSVR